MKTKYTNLAILTFFSSVLTTENLVCICRALYLLPLLFFFCRPCFLTSQLLSFSVSSLVCLSFCGTTKKPRSLESGGGWDLSFIHLCTHYKFVVFLTATAEMWFCFFFCCQLLGLICRVVGFSCFFISGSVLWFTLAADQSKSGQCRHVDEELQVLGRRCTHKELRDLKKKKKKQKKRTDRQR